MQYSFEILLLNSIQIVTDIFTWRMQLVMTKLRPQHTNLIYFIVIALKNKRIKYEYVTFQYYQSR